MSHVKGDSQGTSSYLIKVILGYRIDYQSLGVVCQLFFIVDAEEAPFFPLIYLHLLVSQLELLAAKNLIGANLNGTSDPYAIITCGEQKKFR